MCYTGAETQGHEEKAHSWTLHPSPALSGSFLGTFQARSTSRRLVCAQDLVEPTGIPAVLCPAPPHAHEDKSV